MSRTVNKIETAWQTAIGIQAADGLRTSDYLWQLSKKNISGKIDLNEVEEQVTSYYFERNANDIGDPEKEEADKVAINTVSILLSETFDFSVSGLATLDRSLFHRVFENAGEQREIDVSKREWVLGGDIVSFTNPESLQDALEQCLEEERAYRYNSSSTDTLISHLAAFIAKLWHICPFEQGNTRFTAVFTLLYLRHLGISYKINTFENDSWYFHNALVRANYRNIEKNIDYEPIYLERFFRNLLLSEQWDLRNRFVHVRPAAEWSKQTKSNNNTSTGQVEIKKEQSKSKDKVEKKLSKLDSAIETKLSEAAISPDFLPDFVEISEEPVKNDSIKTSQEDNYLDNPNILFLIVAVGDDFLSVKGIMERLNLKGRDNFLKLYLTPALDCGLLSLLYPKSPRHPRQKYLLTQKGMAFLGTLEPEMRARIERHLANSRA